MLLIYTDATALATIDRIEPVQWRAVAKTAGGHPPASATVALHERQVIDRSRVVLDRRSSNA
ncbi:hypothetical protein [Lentzea guizhouensis]|uniref:hypothetical protein n=1 Tax=Lentzea guizhouensis TaxID=1586287 RepID=UPI0012B6A7A2|nr:hypothetical protein [Lentzea guizhouensis]